MSIPYMIQSLCRTQLTQLSSPYYTSEAAVLVIHTKRRIGSSANKAFSSRWADQVEEEVSTLYLNFLLFLC